VQAKVVFIVPWAGYPLWLLGSPLSRLLLIGGPAMAIAVITGRRLWRQAGELVAAEAQDLDSVPAEDERLPVAS
jgi:hypothetical protein